MMRCPAKGAPGLLRVGRLGVPPAGAGYLDGWNTRPQGRKWVLQPRKHGVSPPELGVPRLKHPVSRPEQGVFRSELGVSRLELGVSSSQLGVSRLQHPARSSELGARSSELGARSSEHGVLPLELGVLRPGHPVLDIGPGLAGSGELLGAADLPRPEHHLPALLRRRATSSWVSGRRLALDRRRSVLCQCCSDIRRHRRRSAGGDSPSRDIVPCSAGVVPTSRDAGADQQMLARSQWTSVRAWQSIQRRLSSTRRRLLIPGGVSRYRSASGRAWNDVCRAGVAVW